MLKIAVPMVSGRLCTHFGHCEMFAFVEADEAEKKIVNTRLLAPPPHEPGVIPRWIAEQGADVVIVGGMGEKARQLLTRLNVRVVVGAAPDTAENLAAAWLNGTLACGENGCDHGNGHGGHGHGHGCAH